jgi:UbiD family decarboxylase
MILDKDTLSVQIRGSHPVGEQPQPGERTGARADGLEHILQNEVKGLPTPCAIALSMDPLLTMAAGSPVPADAEGMAEYEAAGAWRGSPTELVKCETNDLLVPANAEVIIEGEVLPSVRTPEGPHGESNGFYVAHQETFVMKVKCITHRAQPVSYGLYCWMVEDYPRDLFRGASFQRRLVERAGLTNIKHVHVPKVGRNGMVIISAKIRDAEDPRRIMEAAWENGGERWVVVVDDDCDVRSWTDVLWRVTYFAQPKDHIFHGPERPARHEAGGVVDDPFEPPTSGLGIDATMHFKGYQFNPVNRVSPELRAKVASRWAEYGLS